MTTIDARPHVLAMPDALTLAVTALADHVGGFVGDRTSVGFHLPPHAVRSVTIDWSATGRLSFVTTEATINLHPGFADLLDRRRD